MFFILNTSLISSESATSLFTALFRDVFTQQYLCTLRVLLSAEFLLFQHKVWKRRKQNVIFNQIYFKALHYLKGKILNGHTWWTSIANLNEKTIKAIVKKICLCAELVSFALHFTYLEVFLCFSSRLRVRVMELFLTANSPLTVSVSPAQTLMAICSSLASAAPSPMRRQE